MCTSVFISGSIQPAQTPFKNAMISLKTDLGEQARLLNIQTRRGGTNRAPDRGVFGGKASAFIKEGRRNDQAQSVNRGSFSSNGPTTGLDHGRKANHDAV